MTKYCASRAPVADLDGSETVNSDHISQAVQYRSLDRTLWRNVK